MELIDDYGMYDNDNDFEDDDDDDFDETQMPKGWEKYTDEEILGRIGLVALEFNQRDEDEEYLKEEGFENEDHLMGFKDYFENHYAEKKGISIYDVMGIAQKAVGDLKVSEAETKKGAGGIMEPVEGVSCENWATANAAIMSGKPQDQVFASIGVDMAKWDRVNNEWQTRMSNDTSFTITQIYSNAFTASATGNLGSASEINEENFPYEKYIEITVAQDRLTSQGRDPQQVLGTFGLTVTDWSNAGAFWSQKIASDFEFYNKEHNRLTPIYEEKYKAGSIHDDIEF